MGALIAILIVKESRRIGKHGFNVGMAVLWNSSGVAGSIWTSSGCNYRPDYHVEGVDPVTASATRAATAVLCLIFVGFILNPLFRSKKHLF